MNIIGLDIGTTTISAIVLDGVSGEILKTVNISNGADLQARMSAERIQDPEAIAQKALKVVETLKAEYEIAAIGLDGQMHGIVYVDGQGQAVSPLFTWQDQRGELPQGDTTYAGELSRRTGYRVATGYGILTHFWHVVNGCVPQQARSLCTIYDYVGMKLTGRTAPLLHISTAASLGLVDTAQGSWDLRAMELAGIDPAILPEVSSDAVLIGRDADGIPVACGIGDNQASFIGAMREMAGGVLVNMGTGGQVSMLSSGQAAGGELELRPLGGGASLIVGSALCGGRSYALLEGFLRSCAELAGSKVEPMYEAMNSVGIALLDDPEIMKVDTRFSGTRLQPELRGSIGNLSTQNYDAGHLIAGTLMGMAGEIHRLYSEMLSAGSSPAAFLVGSGNGIRKNPALKRAFEKVFGMPLHIPAHTEEAAYGTALFAMTAAGLVPTLGAAQALIRYN